MKKASGPAKTSTQWRKEVASARERLNRGWLAALAHGGMYVAAALWMGLGTALTGEVWARTLGAAGLIVFMGWLVKRGLATAAGLLLVLAVASFLFPLVFRLGLRLELTGIVFAWFYLDALRGARALKRRLHAAPADP